MRRFWLLCAVLALLLTGTTIAAVAQTAPTVATSTTGQCNVPRYDIHALLQQLAATPVAQHTTPAAQPTPPNLAQAKPADAATVHQVETLMNQFVACGNSGDPLRQFSFYTPRYLIQAVGALFAGRVTPQNVNQLAQGIEQQLPTPVAIGQRTVLDHIERVQVLPDGRITATVYGKKETDSGHGKPVLFVFVKSGGKLLIDNFFILAPNQQTPPA